MLRDGLHFFVILIMVENWLIGPTNNLFFIHG